MTSNLDFALQRSQILNDVNKTWISKLKSLPTASIPRNIQYKLMTRSAFTQKRLLNKKSELTRKADLRIRNLLFNIRMIERQETVRKLKDDQKQLESQSDRDKIRKDLLKLIACLVSPIPKKISTQVFKMTRIMISVRHLLKVVRTNWSISA